MTKYGKKSQESVKKAVTKYKKKKLKIGTSDKTVTSKKQAIAIGLSEARAQGAKMPTKKKSSSKTSSKATKKTPAASKNKKSTKK